MLIFGTRPEAIKMAPVVKELEKYNKQFKTVVCVTAQHRQMLDQVLYLYDIKPAYDLNIMKPKQDLFDVTSEVLLGLKTIIKKERPDIILVHGDTTTTMTASLAGYYLRTPIGHVEAGLRTHQKFAPFPEEINRTIASALADIHFAPTDLARRNLLNEGVNSEHIYITGNTIVDALFSALDIIQKNPNIKEQLSSQFSFLDPNKRLILVTGHRRESFGIGFENICRALVNISETHDDIEILYPVHLNPNVQEPVKRILGNNRDKIHLLEPVDYLPFIYLMNRSFLVITDSGGIQEEAPSLGKPVLVMRDFTERPEAVIAGTVKLVGTDQSKIIAGVSNLLDNVEAYKSMTLTHNPYGDGKAAERITEVLKSWPVDAGK